jgi:hypothetical protein
MPNHSFKAQQRSSSSLFQMKKEEGAEQLPKDRIYRQEDAEEPSAANQIHSDLKKGSFD